MKSFKRHNLGARKEKDGQRAAEEKKKENRLNRLISY